MSSWLKMAGLSDHAVVWLVSLAANMFISHDGTLKIGDFGLARWLTDDCQYVDSLPEGTYLHNAPEVC